MRAVGKGHTQDGCIVHRETVRGAAFHFEQRRMNEGFQRGEGLRGRGSGEGDGGQNRMSDEKVGTEVGGGGEGAREKSEEAGKVMRHTVAER